MDLIKLENEGLSNLVDSKVIPLTPSSIVSQFFFSVFVVYSLDLFKFLHEFQVNGRKVAG